MRPASLATALLVASASLVPGLAMQQAGAASGRCDPGKGVTVVVDYGPLRSGTDLFCAGDGGGQEVAEIMRRAGVGFEYTSGQPFVCRIQGLPGADRESCTNTPPPNAYWGLFTSDGSTSWRYASQGAASQNVPNGGSVGWRFQDGGSREDPGLSPTPRPAPKPEPRPDPKPSPAQADGPGSATDSGPARSAPPTPQQATSASASASPSASTGAERSQGPADGGKTRAKSKDASAGKDGKRQRREDSADRERATESSSVTDSAADPVEEVEPLSAAGDDTGSAGGLLPLLVGGLVVLGLGGYAAIVAWRRRV